MDPDLQHNLAEAVRRWARPTTPEELRQRGVSRLRSIELDKLETLIERAVNRTLMERTLGDGAVAPEADGALGRAAGEEFMRLLAEVPNTSKTGRSLDQLKGEFRARRRAAEARERELALAALRKGAPAHESFEEELAKLFDDYRDGALDEVFLQERTIALAREILERDRLRTVDAELQVHRREIDVLERRLRKVTDLLAKTEDDLKRLIARGNVDPGLASIYDSVQGLDLEDEQYERKGAFLSAIFDANLQMRREIETSP